MNNRESSEIRDLVADEINQVSGGNIDRGCGGTCTAGAELVNAVIEVLVAGAR
jgi:hypothetical protein